MSLCCLLSVTLKIGISFCSVVGSKCPRACSRKFTESAFPPLGVRDIFGFSLASPEIEALLDFILEPTRIKRKLIFL